MIVAAAGVGFTVMVTDELVIVAGLAQVALDVKIQVTTSPSFIVAGVNVELLVPALLPFTCHW